MQRRKTVIHPFLFLAAILSALTLMLPCAFTAHASVGCPVEMEAYWKLDETSGSTFDDSSGTNDAFCADTCPEPTANGKIGGGMRFARDLSTGIDALGDSFNWSQNASFSVELWMKKASVCSNSTVLGNEVFVGRYSASTSFHWWVGIDCTAGGAAAFTLADKAGNFFSAVGNRNLTDGKWHHIVAVKDSATDNLRLYVDGKLEAQTSAPYTTDFSDSEVNLNIGWLDTANGSFRYSGVLDEVAIYSKALLQNEVLSHYYIPRQYCDGCSAPIKIMPLGDSITQGNSSGADTEDPLDSSNWVSYRKELWDGLGAAGFSVDLVGTLQSGQAVLNFDFDHEGHSGYRADQIADEIAGWLAAKSPEVILLHIGTNDIQANDQVQTIVDDVADILDAIDDYSEDVTVVIARIINPYCAAPPCQDVTTTGAFNSALQTMVDGRIALGDKIIVVDMENGAGLNYALQSDGGDMWDELHPYETGYQKMAGVWLNALQTFLPACSDVPPQITSVAVTTVFVNHPYNYTVTATGEPAPVFSLDSPPQGMTIDGATGKISWTPAAAGAFNVAVVAQNNSGQDRQDFVVTVNEDPLCLSGIIAYWKLDEGQGNSYDDFIDAHEGSCIGQCPDAASGQVGGAQAFNGTDTGINVAPHTSFDWTAQDSFTIEYWMKKSSSCTGNEVAVGRDAAGSENKVHWWTGCWGDDGAASFVLIAKNGDGSNSSNFLHGTTPLNDEAWHHVAVVRDGSSGKNLLYVDGFLEDSRAVAYRAGFDSPTADLNIGWLRLNSGYRFEGILDEIAVYGRALSASEIQEHFAVGLEGVGYCHDVMPPMILDQPISRKVIEGSTAMFEVVAASKGPVRYQWRKNGVNILGATSAAYTTPPTTMDDNGATFYCIVKNQAGKISSSRATLTVLPNVPPTITTQPKNQKVYKGKTATFSVVASGAKPLGYQWRKNGVNIPGATNASYTTPVTTMDDNGATFYCIVKNYSGKTSSKRATLTVR
jgi:lysophospholipase L1-like esterase